ncbi:MAG: peptide chain release factor N(5)-glutamine methyltransferase [Desulfobulbaceae bacterium]
MHFSQLFARTVSRLEEAGIESAEQEALLLFEYSFGLSRAELILHGDRCPGTEEAERFEKFLRRRLAREPLAYLTGSREFWSLPFVVSPAVLVPRPETEFVLETALRIIRSAGYQGGPILDLCTGSGAIAVVLARELGFGQVIGVDVSFEALQVAATNVSRFALSDRISLVCADLFTAFAPEGRFEVIVSNPPYVAAEEISELEPEVRDWEPRFALSGGKGGLEVIRRIIDEAWRFLHPSGWLFMEIGAGQEQEVCAMCAAAGAYVDVEVLPDWAGRPRLLRARKRRANG